MQSIAAMIDHAAHRKGLLLTFVAVLILSPDALLVRLIHCDVWTLLFWRCLLTGAMQSVFLAVVYRGQLLQSFRNIGRTGLLSAGVVTCGSFFFVNSLKQTAAANTLIILAATPVFSSLLSWLFLREKIARHTGVSIAICFGGILLIFSGSLSSGLLLGDLLALGATLMWASNLVILRRGKAVNMIPANLLGNLMVVPVALLAGAQPLAVSATDMTFLLLLGGLVLPISFTMITLGPRYLPAPEVSLILLVETILGPLWVWLALNESPHANTLLAGVLIVGTLTVHTLMSLWALRRPKALPELVF
ncbi:MAG: DMT family transporter [Desulfuromonadales bacterium]|nr:DMT family transporter [Desulfuromonadales bacterium]